MNVKFSIVKKGYDQKEVTEYIDSLEAVIKSYKDKDAAIKNAIINAQIAADNIVNESETKAQKIYNDAVGKFSSIYEAVNNQRGMMQKFQDEYNTLINKYVHQVNERDFGAVYDKIGELEEMINNLRNQQENAVL